MRRFLFLCVFILAAVEANAAPVDSVGFAVSPFASYARASLRDSSFPTSFHIMGATNRYRFEYLGYRNDLPSDINQRQYDNSSMMMYYNMEFLLRARRGSILGRTRLFVAGGAGFFRSRLNDTVSSSEYNFGYGFIGGFRYFASKQFYFGGEAKYLTSTVSYDNPAYGEQDIGGLFLSVLMGVRFSE